MMLPLSPAQIDRFRRRANKRRPAKVDSLGIEPPRAVEASYSRDLRAIVRELTSQVEAQVVPLLEQMEPEYVRDSPQIFIEGAVDDLMRTPVVAERTQQRIAARMANNTESFNRNRFVSDINKAVGINLRDIVKKDGVATEVEQAIENNIALIKSIPEQYHTKLKGVTTEGINSGNDAFSIRKQIFELGQVTERRARFIARDQVAKLNAAVNKARQTKVGITHYFWRTSRDERVRETHEENEGKRFAWNNPPATGHPGEDYNCRCSPDPDLSGMLEALGAP
ncbi:MAG: minor capsid protein, partial [Planctomycetes bacterium]|nr:minor capsid protein [Planctomycetota bacterium]